MQQLPAHTARHGAKRLTRAGDVRHQFVLLELGVARDHGLDHGNAD
jgi:hypothetical protein